MTPRHGSTRFGRRAGRGAALIEDALAFLVFAVLAAGIMELGLAGAIANTVSFAAQRAARYASVNGSASGHAATVSAIQGIAQQYAAPFNGAALTTSVSWSPDNNPGSAVTVTVGYALTPALLPISSTGFTLHATASHRIIQ